MKLKELFETPYLHHEELLYKAFSCISINRLNLSYTKLGKINEQIEIYKHNNGSIIAGQKIEQDFFLLVSISTRKQAYPVTPKKLTNILQISMVNVESGEEEKGITKRVYNFIGSKFDLVSDHEQYLGAQGLWKSLAKSSNLNVYIYNGLIDNYIRDKHNVILKYNSSNIPSNIIWGTTAEKKAILLVGTLKEL